MQIVQILLGAIGDRRRPFQPDGGGLEAPLAGIGPPVVDLQAAAHGEAAPHLGRGVDLAHKLPGGVVILAHQLPHLAHVEQHLLLALQIIGR